MNNFLEQDRRRTCRTLSTKLRELQDGKAFLYHWQGAHRWRRREQFNYKYAYIKGLNVMAARQSKYIYKRDVACAGTDALKKLISMLMPLYTNSEQNSRRRSLYLSRASDELDDSSFSMEIKSDVEAKHGPRSHSKCAAKIMSGEGARSLSVYLTSNSCVFFILCEHECFCCGINISLWAFTYSFPARTCSSSARIISA